MRALPGWVARGLRAGLGAAAATVASGAALLLVVLLAHAEAVAGSFAAIAPDVGSGAGLWLLDAAYLPNAVVAASSWLLGPGFAVGGVVAAPTGATPGLLPPVPLAALLPSGPPPTWAGLAFALPLAVGSADRVAARARGGGGRVGWPVGRGVPGQDVLRRVRPVLVAALTAGVVLALAAALAGGQLGSGPFDPVVVPAGPVLLATFAWIAVPGAVVALLAAPADSPAAGRRPRREPSVAVPDASPEPEDDVVDTGSVEEVPDEVPTRRTGPTATTRTPTKVPTTRTPPSTPPARTTPDPAVDGHTRQLPGPDDLRGVPMIVVAWVACPAPDHDGHTRQPPGPADLRGVPLISGSARGGATDTAPTPTADYARR